MAGGVRRFGGYAGRDVRINPDGSSGKPGIPSISCQNGPICMCRDTWFRCEPREDSILTAIRTLIADADWQFLKRAFQALPRRAYDLVVEPNRAAALCFARQWRPQLLIAPHYFLADWQRNEDEVKLPEPWEDPPLIVTAHGDDPADVWQPWLAGGYEVLVKPLLHAAQLDVAVRAALAKAADGPAVDMVSEYSAMAKHLAPRQGDSFAAEAAWAAPRTV